MAKPPTMYELASQTDMYLDLACLAKLLGSGNIIEGQTCAQEGALALYPIIRFTLPAICLLSKLFLALGFT